MPGLDRTGPQGEGPRTGRQMGRCAPPSDKKENLKSQDGAAGPDTGSVNPEEMEGRGFGRLAGRQPGWGTGRGTGRGMGRGIGRHRNRKRGN
jgi:hypothetical protein